MKLQSLNWSQIQEPENLKTPALFFKRGCCISLIFIVLFFSACKNQAQSGSDYRRADETLHAIYKYYGVEGEYLLRETYPFDENRKATYLADEEQADNKKPYAYLWPYSGSLSAVTALYEAKKARAYLDILADKVLPGLDNYYDIRRTPPAYASYINTAALSDRFYDDNIWIGLDFTDLYLLTKEQKYLDKAETIWTFIESGTDTILGGGIYWCEQEKNSKNACSNAPGAVYALKLFEATNDSSYFYKGKNLYEWTKIHLQDTTDFLYYDNIRLNGQIGKAKYAYNSGQMLQASTLLYKLTKEDNYLKEAQKIAQSCYNHFFHDFTIKNGDKFRLLNKGDIWFTAIMFRGFVELYHLDNNREYIDAFQKNLDYAWEHMRGENGLFNSDWSGETKDESKWLLTQFAMVEMYARMSAL